MAVNFKVDVLFIKTTLLIISVSVCLILGNAAKLTVPRILLPYNTGVPTNYTLEVKEGGCYKWSSSRNDLVSVTPLPSERERITCTTKALVSAISRYPERENAIILAEDEKSGQILRCDVVIDSIYTIEIVTTTRVLFLEDAPEAFEVIAKNDQGDTFSSLAGVAFQWSLDSDSYTNDAYGVLRFLRFADSMYKTPSSVEYWEKQNLHSSVILMEGSKTGSAKVTVKPLDSVYKNVSLYEVSLVIVANLNLKPAHIYLLPGTKVRYHLELIKQGKAFPISLPSDQYYLEVAEKSIAILDTASSTATALSYGSTNVIVKDKYIAGREVAYLPSAAIHVTIPSYLTLTISPGDKWSLEEKKIYFVSVNIYDRNSHPIHITENVQVTIEFPKKFFKVIFSSHNGTFQEIYTLVPGSCQISASLIGVQTQNGNLRNIEQPLTASQDVIIYESIKVRPGFTMLPWDPISKPVYSIYLKATGGTGSYNWLFDDPSLGSVHSVYHEEEQKARVTTVGHGKFQIHANDAHLSMLTGSSEVSVQPVGEMKIFASEVEVQLNQSLILPLAMYGYHPGKKEIMSFSNCSEIPIVVEIDEMQKFTYINDNILPVKSPACRNIHLQCFALGFNRVVVRYIRNDISLKGVVIISCYRKLKVVHPTRETLLAIGTSMEMVFEGGPRPWPRCIGHYVNTSPEYNFADVSVLRNESDLSDIHKVRAFCKGFGEDIITLKVGNRNCSTNVNPAMNEAPVRIACVTPELLILKPTLPALSVGKCPVSGDNMIAIHSAQVLEIELLVKDSLGREFQNISSFDIKWFLSDYNLAFFQSNEGIKVKYIKVRDMKIKAKNYQTLHPRGSVGNLKVTASIMGYKPEVLKNIDLSLDTAILPAINSSLSFVLVEEADVQPKKVSVFNNPSNKVYLNVTKGSGYFRVEASDASKAEVVFKEATSQVEITPLDTGSLTITITDLCLGKKHEAVAQIQIYGISAIMVNVLDKVELGKSITATVEVLNEEKQRIPASMFSLMNLQPVVLFNAISIKLASTPEPHQFQASYTITGLSLGQASFKVITTANVFKGGQYSSDISHIQVFPPLQLNPDRITLIIGATFQILCTGGPQPQTSIEYVIDDEETAIVSVAGIVEAKKRGETILIARSVGYDKKGNSVIYSQDTVIVKCIILKEVKIHSPLSRMLIGTEMPLYAMGLSEQETPFTFGTAFPSANFKWSVSNDKVASLYDVYNTMGIQETSENNFCVRIKAQQDGLVTVHLEVTLPKNSAQTFFGDAQFLSSEVQIQVFKRLTLELPRMPRPEVEGGIIILSQNSQLKLKCNRLGFAKVSYTVLQSEQSTSKTQIVTVDEQGTLAASSKIGSAILLVTAVEEFGVVQRLTVIVKVAEIAYMMVKPTTDIKTRDWPLTTLPVGFTIPFVVTYHDNIGETFDAVRSQLKFRASRYNLARISFGSNNDTLVVQVIKPGFTVLKVWVVDSPIPPEYIKIVAGSAIDPSDVKLTVGDVICFESPLLTQEGHSGTWSTESNILSIHPTSGGAVALSPGFATITYSLLSGFSTSTRVTVQAAAYISIMPGNVHHISNLPRTKPYRIPVLVQSNDSHHLNYVVDRNCSYATEMSLPLPLVQPPFSCELNFISSSVDISAVDIFHSSSGFDVEKGMYYCSIEPINKVLMSEISLMEGQLSLTVHLQSVDHLPALSQQLVLVFMPAFFVQQKELVLSDRQYSNQVVISATPAVQRCIVVVPSDTTLLQVKSAVPNPTFPASIAFPVELLSVSNMWQGDYPSLHIDINCPITKQHVRIPIKLRKTGVSLEGSYCLPPLPPASSPSYTTYDWYWMLTVAISVLIIVIFFYFCRWITTARRGVVTTQPVFLNSSNGSHSFSPSRSSFTPSPYGRSSPPQDFENLSQPLRMCTLDTSPESLQRRRSSNVFR